MPLLRIANAGSFNAAQPAGPMPVIVHAAQGRSVGLVVDQVLDASQGAGRHDQQRDVVLSRRHTISGASPGGDPGAARAATATRQLSFWSAASSSGQEAYSIAMLLKEDLNLAGWSLSLQGTDISTVILERAKAGRFSQREVNRGLPARYLPKYFTRVGHEWEIADELKRMTTFRHLNLAEPWPSLPSFDVVFLRNVMICFDLNQKKEILRRVRNVLRPDGYLFLGAAETTLNIDDSFERIPWERTCYYRQR